MKKKITPTFGWCPSNIINHPTLSFKSKGLWLYCNSKPVSWEFSISGIQKQGSDGRVSISNGLKELEDCGFLLRNQLRSDTGFGKSEYILLDGSDDKLCESNRRDSTFCANTLDETSKIDLSKIDLSKIDKEENIIKENLKIDFEVWWDAYSKKVGRKVDCKKRWDKFTKKKQEEILEVTKKFVQPYIERDEQKYQPHPHTFLNQEMYDQEDLVSEKINGFKIGDKRIAIFRGMSIEEVFTDRGWVKNV